ncbi:hypothetical protein E2562_024781 [Oryza meyeriana var. granulata]|uniref:Uncharacterized protein n=1 Tax=Oryza meyeriana var. granulata TaxID=110450 RepID=A0A6G1E165_9ORYZ|nr:hypothetical protein E2562_024781 [Oryza meyeriana var. granulata]
MDAEAGCFLAAHGQAPTPHHCSLLLLAFLPYGHNTAQVTAVGWRTCCLVPSCRRIATLSLLLSWGYLRVMAVN